MATALGAALLPIVTPVFVVQGPHQTGGAKALSIGVPLYHHTDGGLQALSTTDQGHQEDSHLLGDTPGKQHYMFPVIYCFKSGVEIGGCPGAQASKII